MTQTVEIHMEVGGTTRRVGLCRHISKARGSTSVFEYDEDWLRDPEAFAIDPENLPLRAGPFARRSALPGAIRDTAPDRWGRRLIQRAFRKTGERRSLSEIDYLLGLDDSTRIGALRCERPGDDGFGPGRQRHRVPPIIQLPALRRAADAIHQNAESADDLRLLLHEGSPLGGARPKSAVRDEDGSLAIAKFPKPDDERSVPHGEVLAMRLALQAGLNAAPARIEVAAGRPVAVVSRFDRRGDDRIPFVSAMTMLGLEDGETATYTDIAEVIRKRSVAPTADLREIFGRAIFNVLVSNLDDHLRNHGFLHAEGEWWRLAPAYDLNPVPAFEKARELSTWISEEGPDASLDLARAAAPRFGLNPKQANDMIARQEAALANWRVEARRLGMSAPDIKIYETAFRVAG